MNSNYLSFVKKTTILTAVVAVIVFALSWIIPSEYLVGEWPFVLLFFYAMTLIVHRILLKALKGRFNLFVNYYMIASFLKLMVYLIVLVVYFLVMDDQKLEFTLLFFIFYICYTTFEVTSLLKQSN